jgi:hypothetical protein
MALTAAAHTQPAANGRLSAVVTRHRDETYRALDARLARLRKELVRDDSGGHFLPRREGLLYHNRRWETDTWRQAVLAWLRDHVNPGLPRAYYRAVLGHDLHTTAFAQLYVEHFHAGEPDPFTGSMGWRENVGQVSCGKVTTAFRDFEALMLVTDATTMGDYKFHRVGTSATAEANTDTALITDAGLEGTGNQTNPSASTYQTVATVTADTTETWQEHSLRNATGASGGTMMDRSLISPTVAVVNLDTVTFTYVLTKTAEA